jgi:hypothetical protein
MCMHVGIYLPQEGKRRGTSFSLHTACSLYFQHTFGGSNDIHLVPFESFFVTERSLTRYIWCHVIVEISSQTYGCAL